MEVIYGNKIFTLFSKKEVLHRKEKTVIIEKEQQL